MDISQISGVVTALKTAKEIGQAALTLRDFNQTAGALAQINEQLLKAQDGLFTHNAQLMELHQKYFETCEELRKLKEAATERGRYTLFELSADTFVYRANATPPNSENSDSPTSEPAHHVCQPCFDKGLKGVLRKYSHFGAIYLQCPICKEKFFTGKTEPFR